MRMKESEIPHNKPELREEEEQAALKVIRSGWIAQGEETAEFEKEFCRYLGLPEGHAAAVSSGTAALYLALWAFHAEGKSIAFPAYVCSALRNAAMMACGRELLIDSSKHHPNINFEEIAAANPEIAIIPHMFGIPQDLSQKKGRTIIIEDCAQALGAKVNAFPAGLQGEAGVFSFYATKLITTGGQGGMVVSKKKELIDQIKDYRHFDEIRDKKARFNFQMTDIQAAVGRVQLRKLPEFLEKRKEIFKRYKEAGLDLLDTRSGTINPVRYRAIIKTDKQLEIINALERANIKGAIPVRKSEINIQSNGLRNALWWAENTVSLPIYPGLTEEEASRIIGTVLKV